MFEHAVRTAVEKGGLTPMQVDILLGGDLLNQIISANFAARELEIPFLGLYGACSTMAEGMLIGSMLIDGGFADRVACAASSHFSTAERQYRLPLEMGSQAVPTSQRTVTGAGCALLSGSGCADKGSLSNVCIAGGVIGRVVDLGITDAANMELFLMLLNDAGIDAGTRHLDCGNIIFSAEQNAVCGGSGCGCSAVTMNGYILPRMDAGEYNRILFMATGALMSPTAGLQGESIPGIAHGVVIERR